MSGSRALTSGVLWLPREVDGEGVAFVGHAHPEIVGGDGADLGDEEVWGDLVAKFFDGEDGLVAVLARGQNIRTESRRRSTG